MGREAVQRVYPEKKVKQFERLEELLTNNKQILLVSADNVRSMQFHNVRIALRGKATLAMGKNTQIKRVLANLVKGNPDNQHFKQLHELLSPHLVGNVGLLFAHGDMSTILDVLKSERVQAPARAGQVAPLDVIAPAINTGLDPGKTAFFQALNIPTKIIKGAIEIINEKQVVFTGEKVSNSAAALLDLLKIYPFSYGLEVAQVYDNGTMYGADVLSMTDETKTAMVQAGIRNLTALCLGAGYTTKASLPHVIANGWKNVLSIGIGTDYKIEKAASLIDDIKAGKAIGGGGGGGMSGGVMSMNGSSSHVGSVSMGGATISSGQTVTTTTTKIITK
jgi:large subunit ribosomal protein LP0